MSVPTEGVSKESYLVVNPELRHGQGHNFTECKHKTFNSGYPVVSFTTPEPWSSLYTRIEDLYSADRTDEASG